MRKSLAFRIIASSGTWVIIALVVTAMILVYSYRHHVATHFDKHITLHLEELVAASGFLPDGSFSVAFYPSDPRYHDPQSGWYWEVKQAGETLKRSPSLGNHSLATGDLEIGTDVLIDEITGPDQERLRLHVIAKQRDPRHGPLVFLATAPLGEITQNVLGYSNYIVYSFLALGVGLLLVVVLQVKIAVKPLKAIGTGISDVRDGKAARLPGDYPADVQPLVDELNNLLEHNATSLERARNRLGDLAHAVKNPLTVINNETRNMSDQQRELVLEQTGEIVRSVDHYLSRARVSGTPNVLGSRANVKTVAADLIYAMRRIHPAPGLVYDTSGLQECWFRGDSQDLEEMLGNLLDNAGKWARSRVLLSGGGAQGRLVLVVEDDGPGIPKDKLADVLIRGRKLDESIPGHGQGLGIVNDIAELYGGSLQLGVSGLGGLRVELNLPQA